MNKPFKLEDPYFSKKIDSNALKTVLDSNYQTAYRLYLITNGIKEIQSFFECNHEEYFVTALIKTEATPIGDAKRQVWAVKHLQPIMYKKPRYVLKCDVTDKSSNQSIYRCELVTTKKDAIYEQAQECINDLNQILF